MEKRLQEIVNRRPNKWGNVTIKEFERDIQLLQDAVKTKTKERHYAVLYLREKIAELEYRMKNEHLLIDRLGEMEATWLELKTDLQAIENINSLQ